MINRPDQLIVRFLTQRQFTRRNLYRRLARLPLDLKNPSGSSGPPIGLTLLPTSRCNLQCKICYQHDHDDQEEENNTVEDRFLYQAVERFHGDFMISGGEPLLDPFLEDKVALAKRKRCKVGINTNGTLLTSRRIRDLESAGLDYIGLSVNGPRKVHDQIAGEEGAYERTVENIKILTAPRKSIRVYIIFTITAEGADHISWIAKIAEQWGVDGIVFRHLSFLTPRELDLQRRMWQQIFPGEAELFYYSLSSQPAHIARLAEGARSLASVRSGRLEIIQSPSMSRRALSRWYSEEPSPRRHCLYLYLFARVASTGEMPACPFIARSMGNLRENTFREIWNGESYRRMRQAIRRQPMPICARCCGVL